MPADMGRKSPLRDGSNKESICAEIKQISSLLQFKTCAPALQSAGTDAMARQESYMKTACSTTTLTFIDYPRPFRVLLKSPHHRSDRSSKPPSGALLTKES